MLVVVIPKSVETFPYYRDCVNSGDASNSLIDKVETLLSIEVKMVVRNSVFLKQRMCTFHKVLSGYRRWALFYEGQQTNPLRSA